MSWWTIFFFLHEKTEVIWQSAPASLHPTGGKTAKTCHVQQTKNILKTKTFRTIHLGKKWKTWKKKKLNFGEIISQLDKMTQYKVKTQTQIIHKNPFLFDFFPLVQLFWLIWSRVNKFNVIHSRQNTLIYLKYIIYSRLSHSFMSLFNEDHNLCSVLFSFAAVWKFNEILIKQSFIVQGTHVQL